MDFTVPGNQKVKAKEDENLDKCTNLFRELKVILILRGAFNKFPDFFCTGI